MTDLFPLQTISIITRCNSLVKAQNDIANRKPTGCIQSKKTMGSSVITEVTPIPASWTPNLGDCRNQRAGWLGTGIANLITDIVIFSVPVVWLADLQMSLHNKITVGIQLFLGAM